MVYISLNEITNNNTHTKKKKKKKPSELLKWKLFHIIIMWKKYNETSL